MRPCDHRVIQRQGVGLRGERGRSAVAQDVVLVLVGDLGIAYPEGIALHDLDMLGGGTHFVDDSCNSFDRVDSSALWLYNAKAVAERYASCIYTVLISVSGQTAAGDAESRDIYAFVAAGGNRSVLDRQRFAVDAGIRSAARGGDFASVDGDRWSHNAGIAAFKCKVVAVKRQLSIVYPDCILRVSGKRSAALDGQAVLSQNIRACSGLRHDLRVVQGQGFGLRVICRRAVVAQDIVLVRAGDLGIAHPDGVGLRDDHMLRGCAVRVHDNRTVVVELAALGFHDLVGIGDGDAARGINAAIADSHRAAVNLDFVCSDPTVPNGDIAA